MTLEIFILAIYVVVDVVVAYFMKNVAYAKGYDDNSHAWALCFWFGIAGWLYVIALPDLIVRKNQEILIELLKGGNTKDNNTLSDELPEI